MKCEPGPTSGRQTADVLGVRQASEEALNDRGDGGVALGGPDADVMADLVANADGDIAHG
jgi:hypothetical protein